MTEELKPCPFCGGEAILCENIDRAYVYCKECGCQTDESHATARYAAEAWNTRYKRTCKAICEQVFEEHVWLCSACGEAFDSIASIYDFCPYCGAEIMQEEING